jgi:hypothetical protein
VLVVRVGDQFLLLAWEGANDTSTIRACLLMRKGQ